MGAASAIDTFAHWSSTGDCWQERPVLVLERGELMRRIITTTLKGAGARNIIVTGSEEEAEAAIESDLPGMVVTDWRGDEPCHRRGLRLIRNVRNSDNLSFRDVPIVLTSQHTTRTAVERARDFGISEFLKKPLSTGTLINRVEHASIPRLFIRATRYMGPDRRRKREETRLPPKYKRRKDVEDGLVDPLQAARNACYALAVEVARDGCEHSRRVAASLKRYLTAINEFGPTENEIVEMHRAALVQLEDVRTEGAPVRVAVVQSLEEVVQMRLDRL